MKRGFWGRAPLWRALAEGWLVCLVLLGVFVPFMAETPPLPRSLYLGLAALAAAGFTGFRMQYFYDWFGWVAAKEAGIGILFSLGCLAIGLGLPTALGQFEAIRSSYAGIEGTVFCLLITGPEYFGVRVVGRAWQAWKRLRARRFVWGLTDAILKVAGGLGLLALAGLTVYLARLFGEDIWGIPPESVFAQAVFWASMVVVLGLVLFVSGAMLVLPPATLFSYLIARQMTARLEKLAWGTRALRKGDLAERVEVNGEDEVAQLQADFNGMAVDLEASVAALQAEKDKVLALLEARRELVAGVSHELRNPAATIVGYTDALRRSWKESGTEKVERDLETIQYEAGRLQTILNDLLAAAQLETGHLSLAMQELDVCLIAGRVVETFANLAWGSKRVQVTLSGPGSAHAQADPLRLEQVLVNLVQNGVRHTSPGGIVAVEIRLETEWVCIEVEDSGEGIAAEDLEHIWEKYYQAGGAGRRGEVGAGLGLALVKELTEAMGGKAAVESWPGQGSVFKIFLKPVG